MESFFNLLNISINSCYLLKEISNKYIIYNNDNEIHKMQQIINFRNECLKYMLTHNLICTDRFLKINLLAIENMINKQKYIKKLKYIKNKKYINQDSFKIIYDLQIYIKKIKDISDETKNNFFNCLRIIFLVETLIINK
ncbi:hypothetical protein MYSEV_286 [Mythimna separata entomopoxvirus 'L']|uniref:Uncharacterized protein n=1 Tax=Mythimna separata entomopoxvirus 'L' TaxID=1293572 RepID=A0A916NZ03_9POXV|nr:hypothetical protein MYSEV_286 [Mythimna separata entomopoxvirus 'L']CCU56484.1 hypothetical protein MYSEV_286 [Mythimna separata entomopoxvirus 'L']